MRRFLNIFCILAIFVIILSWYSDKLEKVGQIASKPLKQTETEVITEKNDILDTTEEMVDLSNAFNGMNGCAVLYSTSENKYYIYNKDMAQQEVSPYSTFKIVSTLLGLHNDIIEDETSTMNYNETEYPHSEWNGNLTLQKAFQTSCIWYFHQIIDAVGEDKIKKELGELKYGNCDVSEWNGGNINPYKELNGFWLDSSLKISPFEQVEVLSKIFEGESIYDSANIKTLKKIMLIQDNELQQIYGKTGSDSNGKAWFVGFIEKDDQRKYFAVYLNGSSQGEYISSNMAKEIALKIIG